MKAFVVAVVLAGLAALASANPQAAEARYERGERLYNLGKFREAIVEFEAAYELDPEPRYLFNLAQAHRFDRNIDRALFFYRRYLDLDPAATNKAEVEDRIKLLEAELSAKLVVDKAAADKAAADKAAADQAAADKLAAAKAAEQEKPNPKRVRIALDVGTSIIYLIGFEDSRKSPALSGRILVAYMKHFGKYTLDLGGSWQITTIPYVEQTNGDAASVFFTQLHAVGALMRPIAGPVWARVGVGLGFSAFGNLKRGNPVVMNEDPSGDLRMLCARIDTVIGFRANPMIDFVLGISSASISARNKELDTRLDRVTTLEGFYLGVYLKL